MPGGLRTKAAAVIRFHRKFEQCFQTKSRTVAAHALDYQLFGNSRRNMSRMANEGIRIVEKSFEG